MEKPIPSSVPWPWNSTDQGPGTQRPPTLSSIYPGPWPLPFCIHPNDVSYDSQEFNCDLPHTPQGRPRWNWSGKDDFRRAHSTLHQDTVPSVLDSMSVTQKKPPLTQKKPQVSPGKSGVLKLPCHRPQDGAHLACSQCISEGYLQPKTSKGGDPCKSCLPPVPAHRHGTSQGCWEWIRSILHRSR